MFHRNLLNQFRNAITCFIILPFIFNQFCEFGASGDCACLYLRTGLDIIAARTKNDFAIIAENL